MAGFLKGLWGRISGFFHSVRFRLTLWYMLILIVILALFCGFVYTRQVNDLQAAAWNTLAIQSRQLADLSHLDESHNPGDLFGFFSNDSPMRVVTIQDNEVLILLNAQGQVVQSAGPVSSTDTNQIAASLNQVPASTRSFTYPLAPASSGTTGPRQQYAFLIIPAQISPTQLGLLLLGRPIDPNGQLRSLLVTLALASLATLALAVGGGYWLAGRAMRPVKTITQAAQQISETDLSRRLNLNTRDELGALANTFDQMLARLEAAFARQRQFTADASHELRTPLTIIDLEASRALESRRTTQEYVRALQVIESETGYITHLVNDLLTLARMDAGQASLKLEKLDISDVALEVIERLAPLASQKGVELSAGDLPELYVRGDRNYLVQMLSNLVENAIKYKGTQNPHVLVETAQKDGHAIVCVTDNGPGIPADHLPHLFERFYRVDSARSQNLEGDGTSDESEAPVGSGLGLAIVQWIAQAHGGAVQVQSQVAHGSTFEVALPIDRSSEN